MQLEMEGPPVPNRPRISIEVDEGEPAPRPTRSRTDLPV